MTDGTAKVSACAVQGCRDQDTILVVGRAYWRDSGSQYVEFHFCRTHAGLLGGRKIELVYPAGIGDETNPIDQELRDS